MTPTKDLNPKYFVLDEGDRMLKGDEYYNPTRNVWLPIEAEFVNDEFSMEISKPVRRKNKEYKPAKSLNVIGKDYLQKEEEREARLRR